MARKKYSREEAAAYKERKRSEIDEMIKRIDEGVKAVFESERYKEYLKFASKFTDYSARNTMLINMQRPDATLVAAYGKWKQLGRQVNKGESGISILAPVMYKTNQYVETQKPALDEFGNQLYNEDGTEKTETSTQALTGLAFKSVYVFDVSQTSGKELPELVGELTGDIDAARKEAVFAALRKVTGIEIEFEDIKGGAKGYYSPTKDKIVIKTGMSDAHTLKTAFHEAAHKLLHDPKNKIVTAKSPRNEKEVQAESVAFMVAEKFGIDTSDYSFPYIASWSDGKQLEQLKNALQEIQSAAKQISNAVESELLKMQKRHLSIEEKLADTELNNIQKAEFLIEDCSDRGVTFSQEDTDKILEYAESHEDIYDTVLFVDDMERIQKQRDSYGYDFTYMTPIDTKEEALAAFDRGDAVYLLYPDNTEGMAAERSEIEGFDGYFGIEKEPRDKELDKESDLIPVSKAVALEMWDKNTDVFIDGVPADTREDIEFAPDTAQILVLEYQYSAELDFDRTNGGNTMARNYYNNGYGQQNYGQSAPTNPNVIGNTPYNQLGGKGQLQFYTDLKNRHADNIANQLNADGVRFSGLRNGNVTTITINKADIPRYEAAVEKVKQMYRQQDELKQSYPQQSNYPNAGQAFYDNAPPSYQNFRRADEPQSAPANPNVIGNTPYNQLGDRNQLQYYSNLKNRHADNIANQLNADGVRFSGLRNGNVTTITINKADIPRYEAAVEKVKQMYRQQDELKQSYPQQSNYPNAGQAFYDNAPPSYPNFRRADEPPPAPENPNVIGNTPYNQLGDRNQLQYYTNLKNRHADNIAAQLSADGVRFSGLRKGDVTTITINKADIPRYEAAVEKVKQMYRQQDEPRQSYPQQSNYPNAGQVFYDNAPPRYQNFRRADETPPAPENPNVIGNTPYDQLGYKNELQYYTNLKNRHADNIAQQLNEDGVRFSGLRKGTVTTITINKADIPRYEAAVEKVKASYDRNKSEAPAKKPMEITAAIDNAIRDNNYEQYRYNLDRAAETVLKDFGVDRVAKLLADYINNHNYDGRISAQNKEWAKAFGTPASRYAPVFNSHPTVIDGFISSTRAKIEELKIGAPAQEQSALSSDFDDIFLYSSERVEITRDFRGVPETKYYETPVNEYFIPEIGWLNNEEYAHEQKLSGLSAKDFFAKVTRINANCIDSTGLTVQMDMSKAEYTAMTGKTKAPENAVALQSALDKLDERRAAAGMIAEKPVEYYAVRQTNDRKFAVCSISADGLVTTVKPNITTVAEAEKVMLGIFDQKKDSVKVELVHPQTLDEKSVEMFKGREQELPDVIYRINLNSDKSSAETHILQEYIKQDGGDTYSVGQEIVKGDYDKCNRFLNQLLNAPKKDAPAQTFEIYQLKSGDETRDVRFMPYERLESGGKKPEFANYNKVYEGDISSVKGDTAEKLESLYRQFNLTHPEDFKGHSLSISDVVVMDNTAYYVDTVGFKPLEQFVPLDLQQKRFCSELPKRLSDIAEGNVSPMQDNLLKVGNDALKLNIPPEVIREAAFMMNDDRVQSLADTYDKMFKGQDVPNRAAPEQEKPQRKPKL